MRAKMFCVLVLLALIVLPVFSQQNFLTASISPAVCDHNHGFFEFHFNSRSLPVLIDRIENEADGRKLVCKLRVSSGEDRVVVFNLPQSFVSFSVEKTKDRMSVRKESETYLTRFRNDNHLWYVTYCSKCLTVIGVARSDDLVPGNRDEFLRNIAVVPVRVLNAEKNKAEITCVFESRFEQKFLTLNISATDIPTVTVDEDGERKIKNWDYFLHHQGGLWWAYFDSKTNTLLRIHRRE